MSEYYEGQNFGQYRVVKDGRLYRVVDGSGFSHYLTSRLEEARKAAIDLSDRDECISYSSSIWK